MSAPAYEKSDVTIRGVVTFTVVLAVSTAAVMALMAALFQNLEGRAEATDAASRPRTLVQGALPEHPPEPILQGSPGSNFELEDPIVEMEAWDHRMDEQLASSGWVDRNAGTVRIPIDEAKRLMLERGLPTRKEGE